MGASVTHALAVPDRAGVATKLSRTVVMDEGPVDIVGSGFPSGWCRQRTCRVFVGRVAALTWRRAFQVRARAEARARRRATSRGSPWRSIPILLVT